MKVIIDTNVLISAVLIKNSVSDIALRKAQNSCTILCSKSIFNEYTEKLLLPRFNKYASLIKRTNMLNDIEKEALFIEPVVKISECRDPKDNKFLELAVAVNAVCIVTGDNDLLVLNPFRGTKIISPTEFLIQF
jgi:uncharacterized protein